MDDGSYPYSWLLDTCLAVMSQPLPLPRGLLKCQPTNQYNSTVDSYRQAGTSGSPKLLHSRSMERSSSDPWHAGSSGASVRMHAWNEEARLHAQGNARCTYIHYIYIEMHACIQSTCLKAPFLNQINFQSVHATQSVSTSSKG